MLFVAPTQAVVGSEGLASLEAKTLSENPGNQVFTHNRAATQRIVAAAAAIPEAGEAEIVERLKQARRDGDVETTAALVSQLDALHGVESISATSNADSDNRVSLSPPQSDPGFRWVDGDILVTDPTFDQAKPSIASAPNGDLYVAVDNLAAGITVYKSTDSGETWSNLAVFGTGVGSRNPSVTYGENSSGAWVYTAFEAVRPNGTSDVMVFRVRPDASASDFLTVQSGIVMAGPDDQIYPRITSDNLEFSELYFLYLTYAAYGIDYYPVYFSRSTDLGVNWTVPANVTGGAENSLWQTRPDIAYGDAGLVIAFEKLGVSAAMLPASSA